MRCVRAGEKKGVPAKDRHGDRPVQLPPTGAPAWCEKGSGTFVRSTLRAKVPDPFSHQDGPSRADVLEDSEIPVMLWGFFLLIGSASRQTEGQSGVYRRWSVARPGGCLFLAN